MSLNPGHKVVKNRLWMMYLTQATLKSTMNCLKIQTSHFMGRPDKANSVPLYNLKCLGGVTNTIFSALLEFANQLLPDDCEALPDNTYYAKKFLRDMGLGYEKISACHNDCMLFWKDNKDLESCLKCEQSKWKDKVSLDDDGQPISASKKHPAKVL
jgi:hypothetical protein